MLSEEQSAEDATHKSFMEKRHRHSSVPQVTRLRQHRHRQHRQPDSDKADNINHITPSHLTRLSSQPARCKAEAGQDLVETSPLASSCPSGSTRVRSTRSSSSSSAMFSIFSQTQFSRLPRTNLENSVNTSMWPFSSWGPMTKPFRLNSQDQTLSARYFGMVDILVSYCGWFGGIYLNSSL